jgi:hypothetical protein
MSLPVREFFMGPNYRMLPVLKISTIGLAAQAFLVDCDGKRVVMTPMYGHFGPNDEMTECDFEWNINYENVNE